MKSRISWEFISRVGKLGKRWGLGEPAGRIWGALAYSRRPMTQREIARRCNYSLGLVSRNLRILKKMNIAKTASRRGKEKLYGTVMSFSDSFKDLVDRFKADEMARLFHILEGGIDKEARRKVTSALGSLTTI